MKRLWSLTSLPRSHVRDLYSSSGRCFDSLYQRVDRCAGVAGGDLRQHHLAGLPFDQGDDVAVIRSGQQITFPVARDSRSALATVSFRLLRRLCDEIVGHAPVSACCRVTATSHHCDDLHTLNPCFIYVRVSANTCVTRQTRREAGTQSLRPRARQLEIAGLPAGHSPRELVVVLLFGELGVQAFGLLVKEDNLARQAACSGLVTAGGFLLCALMVVAAAGCGAGGDPSTPDDGSAAASGSTAASGSAAASGAAITTLVSPLRRRIRAALGLSASRSRTGICRQEIISPAPTRAPARPTFATTGPTAQRSSQSSAASRISRRARRSRSLSPAARPHRAAGTGRCLNHRIRAYPTLM